MGQFRKMVMANMTAIWLSWMLPFLFFIALILLLASLGGEDAPVVPDGSVLVVDLSMTVTDGPSLGSPGEIIDAAMGGDMPTLTLLETTAALNAAADDDRIRAVLLKGSLLSDAGGSSLPVLREVRASLQRIKAAGKTVYGYAEAPTLKDYFLLSAADELTLNPYGVLDLTGLSSRSPYLAEAFRKYGIGAQVVRVGEYKSFAETFTRSSMSEEDREQLARLLEEIWSSLLEAYARERNVPVNELRRLSQERGFLRAQGAEDTGLVDQLGYLADVIEELESLVGVRNSGDTFEQIGLRAYLKSLDLPVDPMALDKNRIGLVYLNGPVVDGFGGADTVGGAWFAREIRLLRQDRGIKAAVIRINSPGGSAFASEQIRYEVARLAEQVPVVVSMGGVAASGGYWIASAGDMIFAQPTTITGSIGVFGVLFNIQELANDNGIYFDGVQTGPFADLGTLTRPLNDQEMARLQDSVEFIYTRFVELVAQGRGLNEEAVREIAGGRVWTGQTAQKLALIDDFGGLQDAIDEAADRAGLSRWKLYEIPREREFLEELLSQLANPEGAPPVARGTGPGRQLKEELEDLSRVLDQFNDPLGVYARPPAWVQAP
ncbi:MAG: signal peptide peptidase SppA [Opitutales bacterium]